MSSYAHLVYESMSKLTVDPGYSHLPDESEQGCGQTQAFDLT